MPATTSIVAPLTAQVTATSAIASKGGLTTDEAHRRLETFGPNAMPGTSVHPLRMALEKFWAPVPWMLEAASVLELALGKYVEATTIALLLVFNSALGLFQESHAQATLAALKSRLALTTSVRRDGVWKTIPAAGLAPGDLLKLWLGCVAAADVRMTSGEILLDQSMLTGESIPIEAGAGVQTFAGALVRRGEAEAEVTATGHRAKFGQTAELVRTAYVVSTQQKAVLHVVRSLAALNGVVIILLVAYAWYLRMPVTDILPLVLTAILASIPVALPVTFTLAAAAVSARACKARRPPDPPRKDSAALVSQLHDLGIRTVMVTGDAPATAAIVARSVGLDGAVCPPGPIPDTVQPEEYAVFAGVLPEDKYKLVTVFQKNGHTVGMRGDGANDAPALRQAQMGIAVSTATDVAAVKEGRITFRRILSYTLNSITKKIVQVLLLVIGLLMTSHAILTPLLLVLIMITGDFLGMALTTDNMRPSPAPNAWQIGNLTIAGLIMGIGELLFCSSVLAFGAYWIGLNINALQTLVFVVIVFGNQATNYTNRERHNLWSSRPSIWLLASSVADLLIAATLAIGGIGMAPSPIWFVACMLLAAAAFAIILDFMKVPAFWHLGIT